MGSLAFPHLSSLVLHKITRCILETIVEQAPLAIEDIMNELDTQSGENEESDGGESEESDGGESEVSDGGESEASDGGEESSEDEQDLQDTPPKSLHAGEEPSLS